MATALLIDRQISLKALTVEMPHRLAFGVRLALRYVPTIGRRVHDCFPVAARTRSPSSAGAHTRSQPKRSIATSKVSRGVARSVTITASIGAATCSKDGTTETISIFLSSAQITAISSRSDMPAKTTPDEPRATTSAINSEQSARARRNKDNDEER